eukprot:3134412-Pyramimonas_sp.AAC.1
MGPAGGSPAHGGQPPTSKRGHCRANPTLAPARERVGHYRRAHQSRPAGDHSPRSVPGTFPAKRSVLDVAASLHRITAALPFTFLTPPPEPLLTPPNHPLIPLLELTPRNSGCSQRW